MKSYSMLETEFSIVTQQSIIHMICICWKFCGRTPGVGGSSKL